MILFDGLNERTVYIFFRLLNFLLLIVLFVYFFWRYGVAFLKKLMVERQQYLAALKKEKKLILVQQKEAEQTFVAQKTLCKHLEKTVEQWQAYERESAYERKQERRNLKHKLEARKEIQQQNFKQEHYMQTILPGALEQARNELHEQYRYDDAGKDFIKKVVAYMKKSSL